MKVYVEKLPELIYQGDWHDQAFAWVTKGPGEEEQYFSTKADALKYAKIRRNSISFWEAINSYQRS